jgi:excisionase family DNA binding protein
MRVQFADQQISRADDLLTTGEAAVLMGVTRQHVVDLCKRGDIPFATVGSHRRIRRADVEAAIARTQHITRDQRRSLWLSHALAGEIVRDPERAMLLARSNIDKLRASSRTAYWVEAWSDLLDRGMEDVLEALTSRSPRSRELRQNSPFAGLLGDDVRQRVISTFRWAEGDGEKG